MSEDVKWVRMEEKPAKRRMVKEYYVNYPLFNGLAALFFFGIILATFSAGYIMGVRFLMPYTQIGIQVTFFVCLYVVGATLMIPFLLVHKVLCRREVYVPENPE